MNHRVERVTQSRSYQKLCATHIRLWFFYTAKAYPLKCIDFIRAQNRHLLIDEEDDSMAAKVLANLTNEIPLTEQIRMEYMCDDWQLL